MTKSTAKPKVRARRMYVTVNHIGATPIPINILSIPVAVLPADPASIEAMELQIATALQKNDDVWKNAPVEGYLPDARAALAAVGIK